MRILITSAHAHEGETGSALIAEMLAVELSKSNEVLYIKLGDKFEKKKITNSLTYLYIPKSNFHGVQIPIINGGVVKQIYEILDKFNPDVVHIQNIIFASIPASLWAKKHSKPLVITPHHIPTEGIAFVFPMQKNNPLIKFLDRINTAIYIGSFIKISNLVVALNDVVVKSLKSISPGINYVKINNGINISGLKSLRSNIPGKEINFIYPGTFIERKNQAFLVKSFSYLPKNYVLNLYGNKESGFSYTTWLEQIIKNGGITNVKIHNYVNKKKLLAAYNKSHYLVSASLKEVQSLVIVEALAAGKPVIGLKNETIDELIDGKNGLALPQNTSPKKFAQRLLSFVKATNSKYSSTSEYCKGCVERFDIKTVAERMEKAYKAVISKKQPGQNTVLPQHLFIINALLYGTMIVSWVGQKIETHVVRPGRRIFRQKAAIAVQSSEK